MSAGEREILDRLNRRYGPVGQGNGGIRYARAEHVKLTAGFDSRRVCDFMAMDLYPGGYGPQAGPKLHGHEVKCSRSDWLTELRDPDKAQAFARYCDYWWIVAVPDIVRPEELLPEWGLMVTSGEKLLRIKVRAERLTPEPLTRHLQATLTRSVMKTTIRLDRTGDPLSEQVARQMRLPALVRSLS